MSFRNARFGSKPSGTARPPQKGSTYLRSCRRSQNGFKCETSQRLPPAHFRGGLSWLSARLLFVSFATTRFWTTKAAVSELDLEAFVVLIFAVSKPDPASEKPNDIPRTQNISH